MSPRQRDSCWAKARLMLSISCAARAGLYRCVEQPAEKHNTRSQADGIGSSYADFFIVRVVAGVRTRGARARAPTQYICIAQLQHLSESKSGEDTIPGRPGRWRTQGTAQRGIRPPGRNFALLVGMQPKVSRPAPAAPYGTTLTNNVHSKTASRTTTATRCTLIVSATNAALANAYTHEKVTRHSSCHK